MIRTRTRKIVAGEPRQKIKMPFTTVQSPFIQFGGVNRLPYGKIADAVILSAFPFIASILLKKGSEKVLDIIKSKTRADDKELEKEVIKNLESLSSKSMSILDSITGKGIQIL